MVKMVGYDGRIEQNTYFADQCHGLDVNYWPDGEIVASFKVRGDVKAWFVFSPEMDF